MEYDVGLFDCMSDMSTCLYVLFCADCAQSRNWADSRSEDCTIYHLCAFVSPLWTRSNIRKILGQTEQHYCEDCITYSFCCPCAICQDANQLRKIHNGGSSLTQALQ